MRKSDLRNGMVAKTREGGIYLVCGDTFLRINRLSWNKFDNYYIDLTAPFSEYDIVEIYQPKEGALSDILANHNFDRLEEPIWKREEEK